MEPYLYTNWSFFDFVTFVVFVGFVIVLLPLEGNMGEVTVEGKIREQSVSRA